MGLPFPTASSAALLFRRLVRELVHALDTVTAARATILLKVAILRVRDDSKC